ncbi:MAG: hypothetical protein WC846_05420 [Candidatus Gracilibacteria bacterium]|jgi:hypothetical protein
MSDDTTTDLEVDEDTSDAITENDRTEEMDRAANCTNYSEDDENEINDAITQGTEETAGSPDPFLDPEDSAEEEEEAEETISAMEQVLSVAKEPKQREAALGMTDRYFVKFMRSCAERRLYASMEDSGRLSDLYAFWNELTPEGKVAYVEGHGELLELILSLAKSSTGMAGVAMEMCKKYFLRGVTSILPRSLSSLKLFQRKEVLELVALGVLPCDEASAIKASQNSGVAKLASKVLKAGSLFFPEAKAGVQVTEGAAHVRSHYDNLISKEVRPAIVQMRESMEAEKAMEEVDIKHTADTEHDEIAADLPPAEHLRAQAIEPAHKAAADRILADKAAEEARKAA